MENKQRLTKARIQLLLDHPFFGTLATKLVNVFDETVKTTATDGTRIRWNPEYLTGLSDAEVKAVMAHDVMHVANGHVWRRGSRDKQAWDQAADKAINGVLQKAGLSLPKGELMPPQGEEGKAAEHFYTAPPPGKGNGGGGGNGGNGAGGNGKQNGKGQGNGQGQGKGNGNAPANGGQNGGGKGQRQAPPEQPGCGQVDDCPPDQAHELEQEWKVAVSQAAEAAKSQGKLPGDLERFVDDLLNPKVAWETILRDFIERTARNDYNWSVPNRRHLARGIILPSLISEELPAIVIAVDTSGSIGKRELDQFASEVSAVLGAYETTIHIAYADARVAHSHTVTRADLPLKLEPKGGGGTDFRPVYQWVEKEGIIPSCLIYLTDGYGTFPKSEAEYPTLWIMTSAVVAPWGETVELELRDEAEVAA